MWVASVASASLDKATVGCFLQGSKLWVSAGPTLRVPIKNCLPDELPLLCCDVRACGDMAVAVAGGLCATELVVAVLTVPEGAPEAAESSKRLRTDLEDSVAVTGHTVRVSDRGGINAVAIHAPDPSKNHQWPLAVFLGCQNGDVVRLSLLVSSTSMTIVGSESVVHSHKMDVRGIAVSPHGRLCSVGDDGMLQLAHIQGGQLALIDPVLVSRGAELLCCCFVDENTALVGKRDRQLLRVDFGLDGTRKKRDASWTTMSVPHVPRHVGRGPVFSDGQSLYCASEDGQSWRAIEREAMTLEHARAFQSVAMPSSLLL